MAPAPPAPSILAVVNAASWQAGPVSPGEIVTIWGTGLGPSTPSNLMLDANGNVSTTLDGVQVLFNGIAAPQTYVSGGQINAVVPYAVQSAGSNLSVAVKYLGQASNAFVLQTAATAPAIVTLNGSGTGMAAMGQYDASGNYQGINSGINPASPGWYLTLYVTGEGSIPTPVTGSVISTTTVKPLLGPPTVLIDRRGCHTARETAADNAF